MNRDDIKTMLVAGVIAVIIVFSAALAHAADPQPKAEKHWTCWAVRKAVAVYGAADLESMARAAGISDKEIERAKACLK